MELILERKIEELSATKVKEVSHVNLYVQDLVELGPESVPLLERCPRFRGCCIQASIEFAWT